MESQRNLRWKLNWYRQSELEGALLLGRLIRHATAPELIAQLTQHCADEARHALLWQRTLDALHLPAVRVFRSYQSFYQDETEPPTTAVEILALTHIFEQRVHRRFTEESKQPGVPQVVLRTYSAMLRDEQGHLDWVSRWLARCDDAAKHLERYRLADERVYRRLAPYANRIWDIPGLGEEIISEDAA
jgi:hypothetical protein